MGSRIAALALGSNSHPPIELVGALEAQGHPAIGKDIGELLGEQPLGLKVSSDAAAALNAADVLIEFTLPQATTEDRKSVV